MLNMCESAGCGGERRESSTVTFQGRQQCWDEAPVPAPDHELAATSPPGAGIRAERILCLIPGARTASFQPSALFFLRC